MRKISLICLALFLVLFLGCKNLNSTEGKANAQKLTKSSVWIVTESSADSNSVSAGTMERGDCIADLALRVKSESGNDEVSLSIHKSNTQYNKFVLLKVGDRVSFQQLDSPIQTECGDAAFVQLADVTSPNTNQAILESDSDLTNQEETYKPEPSLYEEAFEEATKFVKDHTVNCGEVYYLLSDDGLYACQNPYEVELNGREFQPKELSEADRLNGVDPLPIQWQGSFKINMTLCRTIYLGPASTNKWSEWRDSDWHKPKMIVKSKGQWTITNGSDFGQGGKIRKIPLKCKGDQLEIVNNSKKVEIPNDSKKVSKSGNDLSDTYGIVKNTIFNKKTMVVFLSPNEFFADSGKTSFDGLKYDNLNALPPGLKYVNGRALTPADYKKIQGK